MTHTDDTFGIRKVVGPTILTRRGHYFDFENPEGSTIDIEDIAHALSQICRFTGQTARFYSVAEHSVHCASLVPREHRLAALLHDAAEAYLGDVSRPLKSILPQYKALEARVEAAVLGRFGLALPLDPCVKEADRTMLRVEQQQAMLNEDVWPGMEGAGAAVTLQFWEPTRAKLAFLGAFWRWSEP